jgi:Zn-dependent protease
MKCEFCGKDEALPFVCNYCGGVYCGDHRLPEAHMCKGDLSQKRTIIAPPQTTFTWSDSSYTQQPQPTPQVQPGNKFSRVEIRDIAVAYLGLGLAFLIVLSGGAASIFSLNGGDLLAYSIISLVAVGPGFVLHELSHKFTARRYGHWAEFRVWPTGLLFALLTSLFGIVFAAPGATYISGVNITKRENGLISIAGPLMNLGVAAVFVPLVFAQGFLHFLGIFGLYINVFLALFNLIPFFILDGAKVFAWNKAVWGFFFIPLALVFYFYIFPLFLSLFPG